MPLIVIAFIIALGIMFLGGDLQRQKESREIGQSEYLQVKNMVRECPKLEHEVKVMMDDNKISNEEFESLQNLRTKVDLKY